MRFQLLFSLIISTIVLISIPSTAVGSVGVCYGRVGNNLLPPSDVVNLLKSSGISKVRLFDANPDILKAFSGTGIELMIGVPNEILPGLADAASGSANGWLQSNVLANIHADQIRYITVGNEIFLKDQYYTPFIVPAMRNLYHALEALNLAEKIKLSSAHAASILSSSYPPSSGAFDPNVITTLHPLLEFLAETKAPLMVNVYPFFSYVNNPDVISLDYAVFSAAAPTVPDSGLVYDNLFDATIDGFVAAMEREGFTGIPVVVTETGWPTAGGAAAVPGHALAYNSNIIRRAQSGKGTPKRPGVEVETFLFGLFDENEKSGGEYEKHFGLFSPNGSKAYDLNFM